MSDLHTLKSRRPSCGLATGLQLDRPSPDRYHPVFRCDGRQEGCGFLWSPRDATK